ncbi:MAG: HipA domain-containing protein, partial [Thiotrichaceae bacterium]|nr:HipA domain-containing protein [Thiotrichaceae bacterium]
ILGPTPSLGGAIPKLPLSIPRSGWNGLVGLPTRLGSSPDLTDIILKFEDCGSYPGIIELEKLALSVHADAGFNVPRYWDVEINGIKSLAVERFDRDKNNKPLFMESVYSLLASGSLSISHHYSATYDFIAKALDNKKIEITRDAKEAKEYLLKRLVLAMLTGNGDLHLENLSFLEQESENKDRLEFSPVYDPTPMRAYNRHNMLTPPEMTFGHYGDVLDGEVIGLEKGLYRFSKNLKINTNQYHKIIADCLLTTRTYEQKINDLKSLPDLNKENLIKIHRKMYSDVEKIIC